MRCRWLPQNGKIHSKVRIYTSQRSKPLSQNGKTHVFSFAKFILSHFSKLSSKVCSQPGYQIEEIQTGDVLLCFLYLAFIPTMKPFLPGNSARSGPETQHLKSVLSLSPWVFSFELFSCLWNSLSARTIFLPISSALSYISAWDNSFSFKFKCIQNQLGRLESSVLFCFPLLTDGAKGLLLTLHSRVTF